MIIQPKIGSLVALLMLLAFLMILAFMPTAFAGSVALSWYANPSTDNVISYNIWREPFGTTNAVNIASILGTTYTDSGLASGTEWTYYLTATNVNGTSGESGSINVWIPTALWNSADTPATIDDGDASAGVYGVQFTPLIAGNATGCRFYKASTNTGTHVCTLWSSSGTQLATVTFSGETASGWQMQSFASPVALSANTQYVLGVYDPVGHYSSNGGYFNSQYTSDIDGVLTAPATGSTTNGHGNGVYVYTTTATTFPTNTYQGANYWADVVYQYTRPAQTIGTIALSNASIPNDAASGYVVGKITVPVSPTPPPFSGTLTLSQTQGGCNSTNGANNADFAVSGSTLQTAVANLASGSYAVCVLASENSVTNSPSGQGFTITSTAPTIASINFPTTQFPAGTAGVVGTASATMSPATPAFSGTWSVQTTGSVGGTTCDTSGFFSFSGSTLNVTASATTTTYNVCIVATQTGATGSPYAQVFPLTGTSDVATGVLPLYDDATANWANAGLLSVGGISAHEPTTQCGNTVNPTGITPPASGDDAATINAAISACPSGEYVQLGAGTFQISLSEYIWINNSVVLKGAGSPSNTCAVQGGTPCWPTIINVYNGAIPDWTISGFPAGANCGVTASSTVTCSSPAGAIYVSPGGVYDNGWGTGTLLTADVAKGATTVQVASTSGFSAGMWVLIQEDPLEVSMTNPTGGANVEASADWLSTSGSPATLRVEGGDIPGAYGTRLNQELHLIKSIGTNTLTFDDPVTLAFRQSGGHGAAVYPPTNQSGTARPFLRYAGVENLSITKPDSGIQFLQCAYCWAKNIEVGGWIGGAVNIINSARVQVEGGYFHDCYDCENNGAEYPVGIDGDATENYLANNIIVRGGKGMVGRASSVNTVAYNYVDDTFYMANVIGDYWVDMGLNGSHYAGTHSWLFEGNWADNCDSDETHGNAIYHVFFRNDCTGLRTAFTDPSNSKAVDDANDIGWASPAPGTANVPGPRRAAGPMAFDYWFGYVGNVLGTSGITAAANSTHPGLGGWTYSCPGGNKCIWMSGWVGGEWPGPDPNLDGTNSPSFIFRHGNYDYLNNAVTWDSNTPDHTLPNSFYLTAAPSFFGPGKSCTYQWPWVTPTGSLPIQTNGCGGSGLPAKARFDAGTPFSQP